ncbi:hypothetical protein QQF64_019852, partial [Cirrhinus molitorella]
GFVERKFLKMGDSVTLNSGLTEIIDDNFQWRFWGTLIAEIKQTDNMTVYDDALDVRFRDSLKLDKQTGSLTITNISMKHAGEYQLWSRTVQNMFKLSVYDEIPMKKGDSVTLNSDLTEIRNNDWIQWRFANALIAQIIWAGSMTVYDDVLDGRFRDRLKLDKQTGSLTIKNTRTEHAGDYVIEVNNRRKHFFLALYDEISVMEGDSVTLNSGRTEIMDDYDLQWTYMYENTVIAEVIKLFHSMTVYDDVLDGRFRDRLKLDNQTEFLTITNITTEHAGRYLLLMDSGEKNLSFKAVRVSVY